jgi:hypothetical protein
MEANIGGVAPHAAAPDLAGFDFGAMLAGLRPPRRLHARHTVGLVDPITAADQTERVGDGLPETLEEVVGAYGHAFYKLKVAGTWRRTWTACRASPPRWTGCRSTAPRSTATSSTRAPRAPPRCGARSRQSRGWRGCAPRSCSSSSR